MFLINISGKESIYEQIKNQIETYINTGILKSGDKLPSVRTLANELGINPNTVMKAYSELEKNGFIYTLNKKGVFVSKGINEVKDENVMYVLNGLKKQGYQKEELIKLLETVYKEEDLNVED